jgi:glycosyltransferase involved in cell wall biosynthesis
MGRRFRALLELVALGRMERRSYPRADHVWVATELEKIAFAGMTPNKNIVVVPNVSPLDVRNPPCAGDVTAVAFLGSYGHAPNEAAAIELITRVMPAIRAAGGPERLVLIGREPTGQMRRAAARDPAVEITGFVEDPSSRLCAAGVLVIPIRSGGGSRIKILEAAALGVPVVSTARGIEGLPFEPGVDYLPAESPTEFADAVTRLMDDPALRGRLVAAAQRKVAATATLDAVSNAVAANLRLDQREIAP